MSPAAAIRGHHVPRQALFYGQSRNNLPAAPLSWPARLMSGRKIPWHNASVDGNSWTALQPLAATLIHDYIPHAVHTTLFMQGGEADIKFTVPGDTGLKAYQDMRDVADDAKAAGVNVVVALTCPGSAFFPPANELERVDYNSRIMADADGAFDYKVDIQVGDLIYSDTSPDYADFLHFSTQGAEDCKNLVAPTANLIWT